MALFTPETIVHLCSNIPLNNSYQDTITFSNQNAQLNYFYSKAVHSFDTFTYQRHDQAIRVPVNAETMNGINYAIYRNANFGSKWFYAFVTKIEYVNQSTSLVYLEQDYIQTWYFELTLKESFVERETVADDTVGANLLPEPVGGLIYKRNSTLLDLSSDMDGNLSLTNIGYVLATTINPDGSQVDGYITQKVFTGANYIFYQNLESAQLALDLKNWPEGKENSVLAIYTFPATYANVTEDKRLVSCKTNTYSTTKPTSNGAYTPRNKKLLTYPYDYLCIDNNQGQTKEYKYELFSSSNVQFSCTGSIAPGVTFYLWPNNYEGFGSAYFEMLTLSNFPMCSWNYDTYRQWFAQNMNGMTASILSGGISTFTSLAIANVGGAIGGLGGVAQGALDVWAKDADMQVLPPTFKGALNVTNGNYAISKQCYTAYDIHLDQHVAERIDSFFDRFGYAVQEVKTPNIMSRQNWNYIKTNGCVLECNAPLDAVAAIKAMFDRGITFWHTTDVGNYSLPNGVV